MKAEKAIKILSDVGDINRCCAEDAEALDMAIKSLEQEDVLDKIRAEIEDLRLHKAGFLTSDSKVCIDSQEVLDIIDKHKAESEVAEI